MNITSNAFKDHEAMPERFSYEEGDCVNPCLNISGVPQKAESLALIMEDIDAPGGSFIHWTVFDIPPATAVIAEDSIPGVQGTNDAKRKNYSGPRPPSGTHRYVFNLYALDTRLGLPEGTATDTLKEAMHGHIIAQASLTGTYSRHPAPAII